MLRTFPLAWGSKCMTEMEKKEKKNDRKQRSFMPSKLGLKTKFYHKANVYERHFHSHQESRKPLPPIVPDQASSRLR